jgi:hypothetical protein
VLYSLIHHINQFITHTPCKIEFFEPKRVGGKIFISPPEEAIEEGISVESMWRQYGEIEVFSLENGMFIFRLQDEASCDEILESRVWHVSNKPLILRKWQPGMQILKLTLSSVPVWVKLINLPMEFWTPKCLSYVASGIGIPLCADKVTEEQKRLRFACVLVEMDVNSVCPKELSLCRGNGTIVTVGVEYPWLPPKCSTCGNFGHAAYACSKKDKKMWMPKNVRNGYVKKSTPVKNKVVPFDKTIRKPAGNSNLNSKIGGIRLVNSFDAIGGLLKEEEEGEELEMRTPTTFLVVFEKAISSQSKGKGKVTGSPVGNRGFSPPSVT